MGGSGKSYDREREGNGKLTQRKCQENTFHWLSPVKWNKLVRGALEIELFGVFLIVWILD